MAFAMSSSASTLLGLALRLSGVGGAEVVDGQSDEHTLLVDHGVSVVIPVGVLAGDAAVVVDQPVHGLGRGMISVVPSIWIQGPKKLSVKTHRVAVGRRRRLRTL